jgi:3-keto-5-aminohexanoate cleavage enzyme
MEKLIITAAICGAEVTREHTPHLPLSAEELAEEAYNCEQAGASIIHLHVRDKEGNPTQDVNVFKKAFDAMKDRGVTAIVQPSTGGAVGMTWQERIQPVKLNPEMATLDCGTLNFGEDIFVNDLELMRNFAREMQSRKIVPELECFEAGHVSYALKLAKEGLLPEHLHFDLVLGVPGAMPASIESLLFLKSMLPASASWTCAAVGRHQLPMAMHTIVLGGHVRVGFEDNIYYSKGRLALSNAELVERIHRLSIELGRDIASPDEARELLGINQLRTESR